MSEGKPVEGVPKRMEYPTSVEEIRHVVSNLRSEFPEAPEALLTRLDQLLSHYEVSQRLADTRRVAAPADPIARRVEDQVEAVVQRYLNKHDFAELSRRLAVSPLAKDLASRNNIWKDLLMTERIYIQQLVALYESYCAPLKVRKKLLDEKQYRKIFQNIEELKELAKTIWKKLEGAARVWPEQEPQIGKIFIDSMSDFQLHYPAYIRGFTEAIKSLVKQRRNNPDLEKFLSQVKTNDVSGANMASAPLPLLSLLMVPIIRLYEYEAIMKELWSITDPSHEDYENLTEARRSLIQLNTQVLLQKAEAVKLSKVLNIVSTIKDEPNQADVRLFFMSTLVREKTSLIRSGPLISVGELRSAECYVHLFNDILIVAALAGSDQYFETYYAVAGATVHAVSPTPTLKYIFYLNCQNGRRVVFACSTEAELTSWVADLKQVIAEADAGSRPKPKITSDPGTNGSSSAQSSLSEIPEIASITARTLDSLLLQLKSTDASELIGNLKNDEFIKLPKKRELCIFDGPEPREQQGERSWSSVGVASRSLSLFPFQLKLNSKAGEPIADRYSFVSYPGRTVCVITDGRASGALGARMSEACNRAIMSHLRETIPQCPDVRTAASDLLSAFAHGHHAILANEGLLDSNGKPKTHSRLLESHSGVACIACVTFENASGKGHIGLALTVGIPTLLIYSALTKTISEILPIIQHSREYDALGGGLGPLISSMCPDLADLSIFQFACNSEDYIIQCSDGVGRNLDPERYGFQPCDLASLVSKGGSKSPSPLPSSWNDGDKAMLTELRAKFRSALVQKLKDPSEITAKSLVQALISHCEGLTENSRAFMEDNQHYRVPLDVLRYPGVIDHATCVVYQLRKTA